MSVDYLDDRELIANERGATRKVLMDSAALRARILEILGSSAISSVALVACANHHDHSVAMRDGAIGPGDSSVMGDGAVLTRDASIVTRDGSVMTLPDNCYNNGIGTCCTSTVCMTLEGALSLADQHQPPPVDSDADGGAEQCPNRIVAGFCDVYSLSSEGADECCYAETTGSCCGRPFLVGGSAQKASIRMRADWIDAMTEVAPVRDPRTRDGLARAWLADAQLEHASIASFSRFSLHLLSCGAPADLLADTQRAALDEVEHARACFALASRYAGSTLGPAELPIDASVAAVTLADAAAAAVREGCVGETLAALQARAQLAGATDPHVRVVLSRIADDEARHAELAWRFVRWAIDRDPVRVKLVVSAAFKSALDALEAQPLRLDGDITLESWRAHGRLTPAEERACHLQVAREVIEPCARALQAAYGESSSCAQA